MTRKEMLCLQQRAARKLMCAIALLLVSAILLGTTTYAWRIVSTAPEAREIKTTAGSNGGLEIALQSSSGEGSMVRANITNSAGDSNLPAKDKNDTWGNIIELDSEYGLDSITLYPSRLNVSGNTVRTDSYLSIPEFGADGRISQMNEATFLQYSSENDYYTKGRTYGVNIIGTEGEKISDKGTVTYYYRRSAIRNEAAGYLEKYRTDLRDDLVELLESQSAGILNLLYDATNAFSNGEIRDAYPWTAADISTATTIIKQMVSVTRETEVSLKWALLAHAVADDVTYPPTDSEAMAALGELYRNFLTYPLKTDGEGKSIYSIAEANGYSDLTGAIDSLLRAENQLAQAMTYISDPGTVTNAFIQIIDPLNTFLMGGTQNEYGGDPGTGTPGRIYEKGHTVLYLYSKTIYSDYMYFVGNPKGETTGLFSIMAELLGDFEATESAYFRFGTGFISTVTTSGPWTIYVRSTSKRGTEGYNDTDIARNAIAKYSPERNRGVLGAVYDDIMGYDPGNAMISFSIEKRDGSAYGYSVDLAFQASEDCDLLLQQEAVARVSDANGQDGEADGRLLGSGSSLKVTLSGDMTGTRSGVAKELIENLFIVLTDTDTGQILGLICAEEPEIVLEQGTAVLSLYEPAVSEDGILSRGEKRDSNIITSMRKDTPVYITAIVYLSGDTLPSGALAATQHPSLYGTVNLQFSCSKPLTPMNYQDYRD